MGRPELVLAGDSGRQAAVKVHAIKVDGETVEEEEEEEDEEDDAAQPLDEAVVGGDAGDSLLELEEAAMAGIVGRFLLQYRLIQGWRWIDKDDDIPLFHFLPPFLKLVVVLRCVSIHFSIQNLSPDPSLGVTLIV